MDIQGYFLVFGIYLLLHSPAIAMIIIGRNYREKNPQLSKALYVLASIYFVIGGGICGSLLMGF